MENLRIITVQVIDSSNINIKFTDNLVPDLSTSNVSIIADTPNVPDSEVLSIKITGTVISVVCQPLSQLASYFVKCQSTTLHPFISIHGTSKLLEDGISNNFLITGPLEPNNPIQDFIKSFLKENIYDTDNDQSIISNYINSLSINFARALYDIRQVKNENYLSFTIGDEQHVRGSGPTDRLNEESAYEIVRVGRGPAAS